MKKLSLFLLTVGVLVAAPSVQNIEGYGIGCAIGVKGMNLQDDFVKAEQACLDCVKGVPAIGIDKTDENIKIMVSKCIEEYKASRN